MVRHFVIGVEYLGTKFAGSQKQANGRTVQAELEYALSRVANESIQAYMSGRTDSGVHATQQVVSFSTLAKRQPVDWLQGANTYLAEDLAIHTCTEVNDSFDPRRSVKWRRYLYLFAECKSIPAIGRSLATWVRERLDVVAMNEQVQGLVGEHDFSSFRAAGCQSISPKRCIHSIAVYRCNRCVVVDVVANAFLFKMVRNICGALLAVSRGQLKNLEDLLNQRDRKLAPPTAPPDGLYLVQVAYEAFPNIGQLRAPWLVGSEGKVPIFKTGDFRDIRCEL